MCPIEFVALRALKHVRRFDRLFAVTFKTGPVPGRTGQLRRGGTHRLDLFMTVVAARRFGFRRWARLRFQMRWMREVVSEVADRSPLFWKREQRGLLF